MFDAHCHLDQHPDPERAARAADAAGVQDVLVAGVDPAGWQAQWALAERVTRPRVHIALGLHPQAVAAGDARTAVAGLAALSAALGQPGVVAVGELGLDHRAPHAGTEALQRTCMRDQLAMARDRGLPVVLHVVHAHGAALDLLVADGLPAAGGMVHGFSGSIEVAKRYVDLGLHLGLGGLVTREQARRARAAAAWCPLDRLLVETDAPDQPVRSRAGATDPDRAAGEPSDLSQVIASVAALRDTTPARIAGQTTANARALFGV